MAAPMDLVCDDVLKLFNKVTTKPERFLSVQEGEVPPLKSATKKLYDFTKDKEANSENDALPELIIDSFDDEQIWQELELQNEYTINHLLASIPKMITKKDHISWTTESAEPPESIEEEEEDDEDADISDSDDDDEDLSEMKNGKNITGEDIDDDEEEEEFGGFDFGVDEDDQEDKELYELLRKENAAENDEFDDEDDFNLEDDDEDYDENDDEEGEGDIENQEEISSDKPKKAKPEKKKTAKTSTVVDDQFFKMADMAAFLDQEDAKEERRHARSKKEDDDDEEDEEEEEDETADFMFADQSDEEAEGTDKLMYADFFGDGDAEDEEDLPKKTKVQFDLPEEDESSDDDDEEEEEEDAKKAKDLFAEDSSEGEDVGAILGGGKRQSKSSYEQRQERLSTRIKEMEEVAVQEKPWQLKGEASAAIRPENSLLQEDVDFEHTTRQAPIITEETTKSLEDLIKQRVKDKSWDDVVRKERMVDEPFEYKKRVVLDQEKSKQSLSQIYEQEYLKQEKKDEEEVVDPNHDGIKKMMQSLFLKLDALSNFHYTPKQASTEVKIITNQPAIAMEEVAPNTVSDAALLAPEEIKEKKKGELKGSMEKSETDRLQERRQKKAGQRAKRKHQEKKAAAMEKAGLKNKYTKEKVMKDLKKQEGKDVTFIEEDKQGKNLASSKTFFAQLQEEVTSQVSSKKSVKKKGKKKHQSAAKFKL